MEEQLSLIDGAPESKKGKKKTKKSRTSKKGSGGSGRGRSSSPPAPPRAPDDVPLHDLAKKRYLNYALSVITSRALPDVRDGLKPVQRRILYAAWHDLKLYPEGRPRKCAAIVGEVMGRYHPHGDQAIYDALVRLAQPFSLRLPLVDGQGNFGSIDGDPAAAMRYTEARLARPAPMLLGELDAQTVPTRPTYDALREEPVVLPARFPNLLVNGATGIAVGMATSIPPHNLVEVVRACIALSKDSVKTTRGLMQWIQGPDFPSGGEILNTRQDIETMYKKGHGSVTVRGTWEKEKGKSGHIIITSIPYQVVKAKLVSAIGDAVATRRLPQVLDVRDESTDDIRIVLELKRGSDPEAVLAWLYKHTDLQTNVQFNLTCLIPTANDQVGKPERLDLVSALWHFLDHRFLVVTKRLEFELAKLERRIHLLEGFEIIFNALDEAIKLIRKSSDKSDARTRLMKRFKLDHEQAEAILEVKLYKLAQLEIEAIMAELKEKRTRAKEIRRLLKKDALRWDIVREELEEVAKELGTPRLTQVVGPSETLEYDEEAYIEREDCWVIMTRDGWLKRQRSFTDVASIRVREGDQIGWLMPADTRAVATIFGSSGRAYSLRVSDIPSTTGHGEPIGRRFALQDGERVVGVVTSDPRSVPKVPIAVMEELGDETPKPPWGLAVTRGGKILRFSLSVFTEPSNRNGRIYVRLQRKVDGDAVLAVEVVVGADPEDVCLASEKCRVLIFPVEEVSVMSGPAQGVTAIKLDKDDRVIGMVVSRAARQGLEVQTSTGTSTIVRPTKYKITSRGGRGHQVLKRGRFTKVVHALPEFSPLS